MATAQRQRYPSSLSRQPSAPSASASSSSSQPGPSTGRQAQTRSAGPPAGQQTPKSRRPSPPQYPNPSIDDEVPAPPPPRPMSHSQQLQSYPSIPNFPRVPSAPTSLGLSTQSSSSALNPRAKPYLPIDPTLHTPDNMYRTEQRRDRAGASGIGLKASKSMMNTRAEYTSLQYLLEQAGYKETRVFTPPQSAIKRPGVIVKKTLEDADEAEVRALYSAFGIGIAGKRVGTVDHEGAEVHNEHLTISRSPPEFGPGMRSSTGLLRALAGRNAVLQDATDAVQNVRPPSRSAPASGKAGKNLKNGADGRSSPIQGRQAAQALAKQLTRSSPDLQTPPSASTTSFMLPHLQQQQQEQTYESWWGLGGFTNFAALGRIADAASAASAAQHILRETSGGEDATDDTPSPGKESFPLGPSRGVRKTRSATETRSVSRRSRAETPELESDKEQVAPNGEQGFHPSPPKKPSPKKPSPSVTPVAATSTPRQPVSHDDPFSAPIRACSPPEDELYEYRGLPDDYEAQCDEDELYMINCEMDSIGSSGDSSRGPSRAGSEEAELRPRVREQTPPAISEDLEEDVELVLSQVGQDASGGGVSTVAYDDSDAASEDEEEKDDLAERILRGTVSLDDYESPKKKQPWKLPLTARIPSTQQDYRYLSRTTPSPPRATPADPFANPSSDPRSPERNEADKSPSPSPPRSAKYADRASKLRMAKSTPALAARPAPTPASAAQRGISWFGALKSFIGLRDVVASQGYTAIPSVPPVPASRPAPMRLSPAVVAGPVAVRAAPVICDSASNDAADLPAVPPAISRACSTVALSRAYSSSAAGSATMPAVEGGVVGNLALRIRPSLAKLRSAVSYTIGVDTTSAATSPSGPVDADGPPVLSPRLDWTATGEHAGWDWATQTGAETSSTLRAEISVKDETDIDYSKSFFYRPSTPAKTRAGAATDAALPDADVRRFEPRKQRSIKSLRAALLLPVAPAPPVPPIRSHLLRVPSGSSTSTTPLLAAEATATPPRSTERPAPPMLAIQSPGAWEAGLPPKALVLEGDEWDPREAMAAAGSAAGYGSFGFSSPTPTVKRVKKKGSSGGKMKRKGSKKSVNKTVPANP